MITAVVQSGTDGRSELSTHCNLQWKDTIQPTASPQRARKLCKQEAQSGMERKVVGELCVCVCVCVEGYPAASHFDFHCASVNTEEAGKRESERRREGGGILRHCSTIFWEPFIK